MEFQTTILERYSIISLEGEIDLYCSGEARAEILKELDNAQSVLVDLSKVAYIDSSAVASLVEGYQTANKNKLKFALVAVSNEALQVLKLARLDKVFTIYESSEAAMKD